MGRRIWPDLLSDSRDETQHRSVRRGSCQGASGQAKRHLLLPTRDVHESANERGQPSGSHGMCGRVCKSTCSRANANIAAQQYNETWRVQRKIIHNSLNINASRGYLPYQDLENKRMLMDFLEDPNGFRDHIRRYTNSLVTQIVFGFRTPTKDDPRLKKLVEV